MTLKEKNSEEYQHLLEIFEHNNRYNTQQEPTEDQNQEEIKRKTLAEQIANLDSAISQLSEMRDKEKPFVPRAYKAFQRDIFFNLLVISLPAECLYFLFQQKAAEEGLRTYFPAMLAAIVAYISAIGDWDANFWTISPRDDADEHVLTSSNRDYTSLTLFFIRLYYLSSFVSFPIGAAGGWLGLDTYTSQIKDNTSYFVTNSIFFALLIVVGTFYYIAWCKALADRTLDGISEYQKAKRHDYSLSRYSEVFIEGTTVTVYRSLGFGAIAGYIPAGFRCTLTEQGQKALFSIGFSSTFMVTLLTRPVKITDAWLNGLYAYVSTNEYALAKIKLNPLNYILHIKNLMSLTVAAGLSGFICSSFEELSIPVILFATTIGSLPIIITANALRDLEIFKIAVKTVGESTLKARRNLQKPETKLEGYEERYGIALAGFNALASTFTNDKSITQRANVASFLGRVARGSSFLYFTDDLSMIDVSLNQGQKLSVAAIFAPHNLLNEYVAFRGGMVYYMSQKAAQTYIYHSIAEEPTPTQESRLYSSYIKPTLHTAHACTIGLLSSMYAWIAQQACKQSVKEPLPGQLSTFNMWLSMSGFRSFYYGKADFTPNELIHALQKRKNELLTLPDQKGGEFLSEMVLREEGQPKLSAFTEHASRHIQYLQSFFSGCNQNNTTTNISAEITNPLI